MIAFTHELVSYLTLTLEAGDIAYVKMNGMASTCVLGAKIVDPGATVAVQSSIDGPDFFALESTEDTDVLWEDITIDGVVTPEISTDVTSQVFVAPNVLRLENTSAGTEVVRVALRGNR